MIRTAREVNDYKPQWVFEKVQQQVARLAKPAHQQVIACLGLAFKANIDDLRESPALSIAQKIAAEHSGQTLVVEPNISALPKQFSHAELVGLNDALEQADIIVLLVDHEPFKAITRAQLDGKIWVDTKGLIDG